jgi:hypothetical protein
MAQLIARKRYQRDTMRNNTSAGIYALACNLAIVRAL